MESNSYRSWHKEFCDNLRESTWVKVIESNGDMSYVPLIPVVDPDLTLYDNVNQVLLSGDINSQGVKRRLHCDDQNNELQQQSRKSVNQLHDEDEDCPILDPQDVSECLDNVQNDQNSNIFDSNCNNNGIFNSQHSSGIDGDQLDCSGGQISSSQVNCILALCWRVVGYSKKCVNLS